MHAIAILHRCLDPLLVHVHRRRLATLFAAVGACVSGPRLTLTDIGRRLGGARRLRYAIKRADRLLGNRHLQREAPMIYAALCRRVLAGIAEPLILVDWSDLKADQSLHLLRASLPVGGRALTLYEEVHPQAKLNSRTVQIRFLRRLAALLPAGAAPIIIADAGFRVPFYRAVERRGWRWLGRVRGRDYVRVGKRWASCRTWFRRATPTAQSLGTGEWVRSNPLAALFVLLKQPPQGRRAKTAAGRRARSNKARKATRNAKEPWLLVASPRLAGLGAKQLVRLDRQRMQIEEAFRDMKSQHFGAGLECSRSRSAERFTVLVLIASLAAFLLWMLGRAAAYLALERELHPGNGKRRAYSKVFLARLLLVLAQYRDILDQVSRAISDIEQWVATDHNALFEA